MCRCVYQMRVLPGGLRDHCPGFFDPVAGIRDLEQVLVVLKHLAGGPQAVEQLVVMGDFLKERADNVGLQFSLLTSRLFGEAVYVANTVNLCSLGELTTTLRFFFLSISMKAFCFSVLWVSWPPSVFSSLWATST